MKNYNINNYTGEMYEIQKKQRTLTHEYVKFCVECETGYTLLTHYEKSSKHLLVKCPEGHIYNVLWSNWKKGKRCAKCQGMSKYTIEELLEFIEINAPGYKLLSDKYEGNHDPLIFQCPEGHIYTNTWAHFKIRKQRCAECRGEKRFTYEYVKDFIEDYGHELLSTTYDGIDKHLLVRCPNGHEHNITLWCFKVSKYKCMECYLMEEESMGVKNIKSYFTEYSILYGTEHTFPDCKNIHPLRFDFSIKNTNNELLGLIEFQGGQHFYPSFRFGNDKEKAWRRLADQQYRDSLKVDYCLSKGIPLLVISHEDEKKIPQLLEEFLNSLKISDCVAI